ncbi:26307_t:CDS:2 [Dentiscutata erythropus]|uniref:26307_t:CDS:1 n=1 Tax=Dentiscutata erythropus TaxID=1348616 RepID=A0A9N9GWV5_9GLOM|nr:26307_t:CDS:2 [Dentiscutata erythropus]
MKFITFLFAAGFLISVIQASIETTKPFQSITWEGGKSEIIQWRENKEVPLLKNLKNVTIHLMAGGENNQVEVIIIAQNVKGTALVHTFNVPTNLGPSGSFYFLKYTSPLNATYADFSGFVTINGINGTIKGFDPQNPQATGSPTTTDSTAVPTQTPDNANNGAINNATDGTVNNAPSSSNSGAPSSSKSSSASSFNSPTPISKSETSNSKFAGPIFQDREIAQIEFSTDIADTTDSIEDMDFNPENLVDTVLSAEFEIK